MARKASTRRQKVCPRQLTKRELQEVDRALRAAGSWDQLRQQHEEARKKLLRTAGRPYNDFFDGLIDGVVADTTHYKALGMKPRSVSLAARRQIRAVVEAVWKSHEESSQDMSLPDEVREAYHTRHLGWNPNAITHRLLGEWRRRAKAQE